MRSCDPFMIGLTQKLINVISHFCKDEGRSNESLFCKNVEIYLWENGSAKDDFEAKAVLR